MTLGRDLQAGFFCVFLLFWLLPSFIPSGEALLIPQADPTPTDGWGRIKPLTQCTGGRHLELFLFRAQLEPNRRASNVCGMNTGGWLPKLVSEGSARSPQVAGGQSLPRQQRQLQEMLMAKELELGWEKSQRPLHCLGQLHLAAPNVPPLWNSWWQGNFCVFTFSLETPSSQFLNPYPPKAGTI